MTKLMLLEPSLVAVAQSDGRSSIVSWIPLSSHCADWPPCGAKTALMVTGVPTGKITGVATRPRSTSNAIVPNSRPPPLSLIVYRTAGPSEGVRTPAPCVTLTSIGQTPESLWFCIAAVIVMTRRPVALGVMDFETTMVGCPFRFPASAAAHSLAGAGPAPGEGGD